MLKRLILGLVLTFGLCACEFTKTILPVETLTPPAIEAPSQPAAIATPPPGETSQAPVLALPNGVPIATGAPALPDDGCRAADALAGIRKDFPYEVDGKKPLNASNYFFYQDLRAIVVWFQDESLNRVSSEGNVAKTAIAARTHASQMTATLLERDACIKRLFTALDVIVVDAADNGWFSGELTLDKAPGNNDQQAIAKAFESVYLRTTPAQPVSGSPQCTFGEARTRIKSHFSDGKQSTANMDFYLVVDEGLGTLYAQWSGDASAANNIARLLNVALELQCLTAPQIDAILFTVVDKQGQILAAGRMPGESIASMDISKIEYQVVE